MLQNYLKISFRKLWREKEYAFLNILGLVVGITVSLLIVLYIFDELHYDTHFEYSDRIYRVQLEDEFAGQKEVKSTIPEMIGPNMVASYPEVEKAARITGPYDNALVEVDGASFFQKGYLKADSSFFQLFSYRAVYGNLETALQNPGSIVLTRSLAQKYFNATDVVGRSLRVSKEEMTVTAVLENVPHNTHLPFSMVGYRESSGKKAWNYWSADTYLLLSEKADVEQLRDKLPAFVEQHAYRSSGQGLEKADSEKYALYIQPLTDIHLNPQGFGARDKAGPWQYLYIFGCVVVLILGIACINYMNIATARSGQHAREVGVRKTVGARREQLVARFLSESVLSSIVATALAVLLLTLCLPYFESYTGKELELAQLGYGFLIPGLVIFAITIGLLSGGYGAAVMSSFRPAVVMKGAPVPGSSSSAGFRKILVTLQFVASIGLILVTVLIYQQMEYVRENRLNENDDEIVVIQNYGRLTSQYEAFRQKLMSYPEVERVATGHTPGSISSRGGYTDSTGKRTEVLFAGVGYDYTEVLGLNVVSGRSFSPDFPDSNAVLLNQSAAEWLGIEQAYGQKVRKTNGRVVGIVEDFHMLPLYEQIQPMIMRYREGAQRTILVKLKGGELSGGIDQIKDAWGSFVKDRPLLYSFLDDELDKAYRSELKMAGIFGGFSAIAIFLACLGLFGLSAYSAHRRIKEIGIRKVFGATITDLVTLLSKDFVKLVLLGFLISAPVAWYAISRWLRDFQYKIEISPAIFLISGLAVLLISLLTVSWQSVRAAVANPVDSLRSE